MKPNYMRPWAGVTVAFVLFATSSACGVRQFNSQLPPDKTESRLLTAYGPFYASGQNGEALTTPDCQSRSGRPCTRARASLGLNYQFDSNSVDGAFGEAGALGASITVAGAGKTTVSDGVNGPDFPRIENRDLYMMQQQAAEGDYPF